ncbi:TPA: RNA-processing protein [Candidatus Woesearchaeota archaeon]|nr:RNA-processing protein [Candidatus Woesearchaeota archaeon]HII68247.1 RNA-processing protein [Candidatus Woesearchaeota archaeon]
MNEFLVDLKIPKERVAVLIGKDGSIKRAIEKSTNTSITVDSKEGDVIIRGEDGLGLFNAKEVIRAVGRGFNPEIAELLLKTDYVFELLDITDYAGKSKTGLLRLKGRVIGREGKSRKQIEDLSEAYVSVYGKTVAIIGCPESAAVAKKAVESLLGGSTHAGVYKWLEKQRRQLKQHGFDNQA